MRNALIHEEGNEENGGLLLNVKMIVFLEINFKFGEKKKWPPTAQTVGIQDLKLFGSRVLVA